MKYIIYVCLLLASCQTKEVKNPAHRSIYDHAIFAECLEATINNESEFAQFKKNPLLTILWENLSKEDGEESLRQIETKWPEILAKLEDIRENDTIGSPKVHFFEKIGEFSATTLHYAAIVADLHFYLGDLSGKKIVQIGAGYGGLCKVLSDIQDYASYTLIDLPVQLAFAKKYLEKFGFKNITYVTLEELSNNEIYDCVISDFAFSEFDGKDQRLLFDRVLSKSHSGYLLGHVFTKHFGVIPLSVPELRNCFKKSGKFSNCEFEVPTIEKEDYYIYWK